MAVINVDDIYILDNTGQQVDDAVDYGLFNSNDNLLDNAYFVGGGSQLGDGIFPINQRGQSSYASDGAGIDRWKQFSATVTLASDGVTVTPSAYSNNFLQLMNPAKWDALVGETVTFSIEVLAITGTIIFAGYNTGIGTITSTGIATFTFTMPSGIADGNKFFGLAGQSGTSIKFGRWKLEKGSISTLANDVPPDFGEELAKCKRRLRYVPLTRTPAVISGNTAVVTLNGIEMASVPTPALISAGGARDAGGIQSITSATVTGFTYNTPTVQLALAGNLNYVIGYVYDTVIQLSCEL